MKPLEMRITKGLRHSFWSGVGRCPHGGCWEWAKARTSAGYGQVWNPSRRRIEYAHRVSWLIHRGPPGDKLVLHRCDNPSCINPKHLFLGTDSDNMADMKGKGRHWGRREPEKLRAIGVALGSREKHPNQFGDGHYLAKLNADAVREIRSRFASVARMAEKYGVSKGAVSCVLAGRTWKHIP